MNVYIPSLAFYICGGFVLFVAGMVSMFIIGILAGREKKSVRVDIAEVEESVKHPYHHTCAICGVSNDVILTEGQRNSVRCSHCSHIDQLETDGEAVWILGQ